MGLFSSNADYFRFYANESRNGGSPLYERLSLGIADDPSIQHLAARRRQGQPQANLIFGAVQFLLLGGIDDPLKAYYPSMGGTRAVDDQVYGLFSAFCQAHRTEIMEIIAQRVTNTNEVGRSALLAPAFDIVAREAGAPLALIELGPSAGFNLNFDKYGYRYVDETNTVRLERGLDSSYIVTTVLRGPGVPALQETRPAIGSRIGLELSPIDITREENRRWLKALVWPERLDRLERLEGALKVAALHPTRVKGGDATALLPGVLASVASDHAPCVFHTVMMYQMNREQIVSLHNAMLQASLSGPVWRVTAEGEVNGQNPLETVTPLKITRYSDGKFATRSYGLCDPHGLWFEWRG